MKIDCVLTAVNTNPLYIEFIPVWLKSWKKLCPDIFPLIILIAHEIPFEYQEYSENIILFNPVENISTNFTSQYIRLLYPSLLHFNNGILITESGLLYK